MDEYLIKEFEAYLQTNEKIIWVGESKKNDASTLPKAITISKPIDDRHFMDKYQHVILLLAGLVSSISFMGIGKIGFTLLGIGILGFMGFGIFYIFKKMQSRRIQEENLEKALNPASRGQAFYAMTNERILIKIGNLNKELNSIDFEKISSLEFTEHYDNLASITLFGKSSHNDENDVLNSKGILGIIQGVENGAAFYKLLPKKNKEKA